MSEKKTNLNTQAVLAMKGEGYYSARTAEAKHAIDKVRPFLEQALDVLPDKPVYSLLISGQQMAAPAKNVGWPNHSPS